MGVAQIAMRNGRCTVPSLTVTTACTSALDALGTAARLIEFGLADAAVVGGVEAGHTLTSGGAEGGFVPAMAYAPAMFGMHSSVTTPEEACRPFDVNRAGIAGSEGATAFFLERADIAESRRARVLGHLSGYGAVSDAHHPSAPEPSGRWEERAMRLALEHAGFEPGEVDCLYAHATGTPVGDPPEIRAINAVYGECAKPLPVTSVKGHFGHAAAASGGMSLIAGLSNMAENVFINTANTTDPDSENPLRRPTRRPVRPRDRCLPGECFRFRRTERLGRDLPPSARPRGRPMKLSRLKPASTCAGGSGRPAPGFRGRRPWIA